MLVPGNESWDRMLFLVVHDSALRHQEAGLSEGKGHKFVIYTKTSLALSPLPGVALPGDSFLTQSCTWSLIGFSCGLLLNSSTCRPRKSFERLTFI